MIEIRALDSVKDHLTVAGLFEKCSDYVLLETGEPPGVDNVTEYFGDAPEGMPNKSAMKLGVFDGVGNITGVMDVVRGYPEASDWYIGLLMLDPAERGNGLGSEVVRRVVDSAKSEGVTRILLCVLKENLRGRAFWHREKFTLRRETPPWSAGRKIDSRYELLRDLTLE